MYIYINITFQWCIGGTTGPEPHRRPSGQELVTLHFESRPGPTFSFPGVNIPIIWAFILDAIDSKIVRHIGLIGF